MLPSRPTCLPRTPPVKPVLSAPAPPPPPTATRSRSPARQTPTLRSQRTPTVCSIPVRTWRTQLTRTVSEIGAASSTSLRSMRHTDREGRLISRSMPSRQTTGQMLTDTADPDLSNPTRHRLERPLDTIRSFEAAIERHHRDNIM